jgi:transcriptional regulator with XRE-family HTH domain
MHLYALCMQGKRNADLVAAIATFRDAQGWSQEELGKASGVSQGHASKILRNINPISKKVRARAEVLLGLPASQPSPDSSLEIEAVAALKTSAPFRALVSAALKMHKMA